MKEYKEWVAMYLLIILAIFGAFCFGVWLMAPCTPAY